MAQRINGINFDEKVMQEKQPVLVEFYSDTCIPCKQMSPILADIEEENSKQVKVYKVNAQFEKELSQRYKIFSSPVFLIFKNGKETQRLRGIVKKDELLQALGI